MSKPAHEMPANSPKQKLVMLKFETEATHLQIPTNQNRSASSCLLRTPHLEMQKIVKKDGEVVRFSELSSKMNCSHSFRSFGVRKIARK